MAAVFVNGIPSTASILELVPAGYNRMAVEELGAGAVRLSYVGNQGVQYALERTFNLSPANWVSLVMNPAGPGGLLVPTNTPNTNTSDFWRIRSVP
jgi:hypothetical protein